MGLRFQKSVMLCKGVKLNFGKSGMSVSVGGKGYRKTINTKGQGQLIKGDAEIMKKKS